MAREETGLGGHEQLLDAAIAARAAGDREASVRQCRRLLADPTASDRMIALAHFELGAVHSTCPPRSHDVAAIHFAEVTRRMPTMELASLGLFHSLVDLDVWLEALDELLRFLRVRHSREYARLLASPGWAPEQFTDPTVRARVVEAHRLVAWSRAERAATVPGFRAPLERALSEVGFARRDGALVRAGDGAWTLVAAVRARDDRHHVEVGFWLDELAGDARLPERIDDAHLLYRLERVVPAHRATIEAAGDVGAPGQPAAFAALLGLIGDEIDRRLRELGRAARLEREIRDRTLRGGFAAAEVWDAMDPSRSEPARRPGGPPP